MAQEQGDVRRQLLITHGVDLDMFIAAGNSRAPGPADIAVLKRPRVGFIGGIDAHTFDPPLFLKVARALPDVNFVLVGGCSLPEGWCPLPNVTFAGSQALRYDRDLHGRDGRADHAVEQERLDQGLQSDQAQGVSCRRAPGRHDGFSRSGTLSRSRARGRHTARVRRGDPQRTRYSPRCRHRASDASRAKAGTRRRIIFRSRSTVSPRKSPKARPGARSSRSAA